MQYSNVPFVVNNWNFFGNQFSNFTKQFDYGNTFVNNGITKNWTQIITLKINKNSCHFFKQSLFHLQKAFFVSIIHSIITVMMFEFALSSKMLYNYKYIANYKKMIWDGLCGNVTSSNWWVMRWLLFKWERRFDVVEILSNSLNTTCSQCNQISWILIKLQIMDKFNMSNFVSLCASSCTILSLTMSLKRQDHRHQNLHLTLIWA